MNVLLMFSVPENDQRLARAGSTLTHSGGMPRVTWTDATVSVRSPSTVAGMGKLLLFSVRERSRERSRAL